MRLLCVCLVVPAALTLLSRAAAPDAEWLGRITPLDSPAASSSAEPQLSVNAGRAVLSWVEQADRTATLKFALREGDGWSAPRTAATGTDWFVNWADVPGVTPLPNQRLVAHWLQKSAASTYAYDVRLALSKDDGATWSPPFTPHHDGTPTEHGFVSVFERPDGGFGVVWLDGRETKGAEHGATAGAMTLRAAAYDPRGRQVADALLDRRVCDCCPTAAALTSQGPVVAFRDRFDEEIRDISIVRFVRGGWTTPAPVHRDDWKMPACPVNGPALSGSARNVAVAWFTMNGGQPQTFAAFSRDAGATFGDRIRVDDASAIGRVDVDLLPDGSAVVGWIEQGNPGAEFRIRRIDEKGDRSASVTVSAIAPNRSSGYPRLARHGDEVIFAWTAVNGATSRVQTATVRLARSRSAH